MLGAYWQYQLPLWVVISLFLIILFIPMEAGFRLGTRYKAMRPNAEDETRNDVTITAMLALLGLMLAFTYSFSLSRADLRKVALVQEVNAIGTAFLRADLLPEPGRTEVRQRLFDYVKSRYAEPGTIRTLEEVEEFIDRSVKIQSKIWPALKSALRQEGDMTAPEKVLLIAAINEVIDSHTRRVFVFYDRLPTAALALLLLIAATSLGVTSFNSVLSGDFNRWRMMAFVVILTSLIYIILDYDMTDRGLIQVDYRSLVLLIEEMETALQN